MTLLTIIGATVVDNKIDMFPEGLAGQVHVIATVLRRQVTMMSSLHHYIQIADLLHSLQVHRKFNDIIIIWDDLGRYWFAERLTLWKNSTARDIQRLYRQ